MQNEMQAKHDTSEQFLVKITIKTPFAYRPPRGFFGSPLLVLTTTYSGGITSVKKDLSDACGEQSIESFWKKTGREQYR